MRRVFFTALKACILIALIGALFYFHFIDLAMLGKILTRPEIFIFGAGAIFLSYMTGALRWWLILRCQKFGIAYLRAFQLYTASVFSLLFVPGGTASSDAVRIIMLMRLVPGNRGRAMLAVFGDRFIAVFMLSLLAAILTLSQWPFRSIAPDHPIFWLNVWAVLMPVLLLIAAGAGWLITRTPLFRRKRHVAERNRLVRMVSVLADFFELAFENPLNIILAVGASAITTGLLLGTIVMVSTIAAIPNLSAWDIARAAALSLFANGVPITPGGIGVGEAAFNQICIWIAHSNEHYPYATIFLAYRVISLVVACYGGIGFVNVRRLTTPEQPQADLLAEPEPRPHIRQEERLPGVQQGF
jgi:uncharacterized membrane protein YbhN (UPF0104 family)